jgi:Methylase involved in ubiquinone/menaquinone biosynthesis
VPNFRFVLPAGASALRDYSAPQVDFGQVAADYGRYRAGFPQRFFKKVFADGWVLPDDRVLDLGTGTGTIARGLALRGCHATGLDSEHHLLNEAARLDREAATGVTYVKGRAEATGLPEQSFDVVTAGQCWHWFDRAATVTEVGRVLVAGGRLIIAHFDWLPLRGNVVTMTERLIERYNPDWHLGNSSGLYPPWLSDVADGASTASKPSRSTPTSPIPTRRGGSNPGFGGVGASLPPEAVALFDADLDAELKKGWSYEPLLVPHRVWALKANWPG